MVGAITALVGTEGHQVITAYDGLTAVKRFREEHPDLVLLDLAMPGPDGFSVAGPDARGRPGADPRRVRRERRGGQGPGPRHRRGRLPDQAVRQGRAAGPHRGDHATRRSARGQRARRRVRWRPVAWSWSRAATRRVSATRPLSLTPTEFRLLEALVRANGDIVPHLQLARAGWPAETDPGPALAEAAPGAAARQGRGCRRPARRGGPGRRLSDRGRRRGGRLTSGARPTEGATGRRRRQRRIPRSASDGEGDRAAAGVVGGIGAADAAAAGIAPAERVEVEPGLAGRRQATAARGARDRARPGRRGRRPGG